MTDDAPDVGPGPIRRAVDVRDVLNKLVSLPITTWNYKADSPDVRHIGPMAQDFANAFDVGDSDKHIRVEDAIGVAYASIQALDGILKDRRREIADIKDELDQLRRDIRALRDPKS